MAHLPVSPYPCLFCASRCNDCVQCRSQRGLEVRGVYQRSRGKASKLSGAHKGLSVFLRVPALNTQWWQREIAQSCNHKLSVG